MHQMRRSGDRRRLRDLAASGLAPAVAVIACVAVGASPTSTASARSAPATVDVVFVRGGTLVGVERVVPRGVTPALHALRELLRGPTRVERADGIRTAFSPAVRLRSLRADAELWRISCSRSLLGAATAMTMRNRFRQLAATLAPLGGQRFAVLAAEGRFATTLALGTRTAAWRPRRGELGYAYDVRGAQLRLSLLGYLDPGATTGVLDYPTTQALLAFQGWEGLVRTGTVTGQTQLELLHARAPAPARSPGGRKLEIHRARGVLLVAQGHELIRAVHTSTGASGATPPGTFRVYRQERLSWSVPFRVWMPYASYFSSGLAIHEYPLVPAYPASHGCVRLPAGDAARVYRLVRIGTPVLVF